MKLSYFKFLGAFSLIFNLIGSANAQFYTVVNKKRVDMFYTHDSASPTQKKVVKIKVDYIDQVASDSIMYLGPEFNGGTRMNTSNPNCPKTQSRTWLGDAVNKRFRDNVFLNKDGWSFTLKWNTSVGASFRFNSWSTDSIQIYATLESVQPSNFFGRPDSVRVWRFERRDANNNVVPFIINGAKMVISKNYGLVKGLNMNNFPYDTNSYYRISGLEPNKPFGTLKSNQIYDIRTGDEFIIERNCPVCAIPGPQAILKRKVTSTSNPTATTLLINYADSLKDGSGISTANSTETIDLAEAEALLDSSTYARIFLGTVRPKEQFIVYQRFDDIAIRMKVVDTASWAEDMSTIAGCFRKPSGFKKGYYRYFERAGGPYMESPTNTESLIYISNSTGTRGRMVYLNNVTLLQPTRKLTPLTLAPNPAKEVVNMQLDDAVEVLSVTLIDAAGRKTELKASKTINLNGLAKGIYQVLVTTNTGQKTGRLVIE